MSNKLNNRRHSLKLFTICAVITYLLVILTACLNLFKGYVADTFYTAQLIIIILTIITAILGNIEHILKNNTVLRWFSIIILIVVSLTGNVFGLLMLVSILRYQQTSKRGIYNSWEAFVTKIKSNKIAIVSLIILTYFLTLSITGIFTFDTSLATHNQFDTLLQSPSWAHPFGTDDFGRDLFTRLVVGTKLTYFISIVSVIISVILGMFFGMLAGYFTKADNLIMRILDVIFAIPSLLLAVAIMPHLVLVQQI